MNDLQLIKNKLVKQNLKQEATKYYIRQSTKVHCSSYKCTSK